MRLRFGVAMPPKGGRTCVIGVEVKEHRDPNTQRLSHEFVVGLVERVTPFTVEAARDRVVDLVGATESARPCVIVDVTTAQGLALQQALRGAYAPALHRPHAHPGTTPKGALFASFLQAYSQGRVTFLPELKYRADLDRALVFYMGGSKSESKQVDIELSSEDEAMVTALCLAMTWPKHGSTA